MLRRLKKYIRTVSAFFQNDINEINAQNWAAIRILVWVYLAALFAFYCVIARPEGNRVQNALVQCALVLQILFAIAVTAVKKTPKGRLSSAVPILIFGTMVMGLVIVRNALIVTDERSPFFPLFLIMMALYYTHPPEVAALLLLGCPALFLAVSYRVKPYDVFLEDLYLTVTAFVIAASSYISTLSVRVRLWRQRCELEQTGSTDALTGVMNRKAFIAAFEAYMAEAPESFAFAIVDVDHFKQINDSYGHIVGDAILCDLCEHGARYFEAENGLVSIGRYGGDEFLMLIRDPGDPALLQEQTTAALQDLSSNAERRGMPPYSSSLGLGIFYGSGWTFDQVLRHADEQLYRAKANGGSRCECESAYKEPQESAEREREREREHFPEKAPQVPA